MTDIDKALMTVLDYLADDNGELEGYTEYCDGIGSKEDHHVMKYVIEIWQEMATKADGELKEYAIDRLKDVEQAFQEVRRRSLVEYSFHRRIFLFFKKWGPSIGGVRGNSAKKIKHLDGQDGPHRWNMIPPRKQPPL